MSYVRHDKDNNPASPQPLPNSLILYSGTEGWSTITYDVWNGDYVARTIDNSSRIPQQYQKKDNDNTSISPGVYQRYDINNNPILI